MSYRWGQVFILDAVANYIPKDEREAQSICERITPRLAHANSAVVLSSVKVWFSSHPVSVGNVQHLMYVVHFSITKLPEIQILLFVLSFNTCIIDETWLKFGLLLLSFWVWVSVRSIWTIIDITQCIYPILHEYYSQVAPYKWTLPGLKQ